MAEEFISHEIIWTHKKSSRIWDYYAQNKDYESNYFSKQVGNAIVDYILSYHNLSGNILDFGCGPGFLIEKLLKRGIPCVGLDFSASSVKLVENNFHNYPNFKGVTLAQNLPTPLESNKFDVVFFIETIEHILPEDLNGILREIHRILKNGGYIFVTTPNEENLEAGKVLCPECGCIFHTVQHITSWTKSSLSSVMKESGFNEIVCKATRFRESGIAGLLRHLLFSAELLVFGKKLPHLIYIGKKQ
jgi:SAM-dependent methyltransferase